MPCSIYIELIALLEHIDGQWWWSLVNPQEGTVWYLATLLNLEIQLATMLSRNFAHQHNRLVENTHYHSQTVETAKCLKILSALKERVRKLHSMTTLCAEHATECQWKLLYIQELIVLQKSNLLSAAEAVSEKTQAIKETGREPAMGIVKVANYL